MSSFIHISNPLIYDSEKKETEDMKQVILIDSQIRNHSEMVAVVNSETFPILYSTTSERTDLLALLQDKFMKIERLGICMEMEPEKMFLNLEPFFAKSETCPYSKNVRFLMEIMEEFSIAHLDFIFADADADNGMGHVVTKSWKEYFDILLKEGQVGFETMPYFVSEFPVQQYLKPTLQPWLSGFSLPCSIAVYGEHLYVANFGSSFVSRVTDFVSDVVSDAVVMEWKAFEEPIGLVVHGKYLYVSNYCEENGYISKINLQTMEVQARWYEDLLGPVGLTVWEDNLYICDSLDNKIVRVNIYNPHDTSEWISLESPVAAVCYDGFIYVSCMRDDCIRKISLQGCGVGKIIDQWEIGNPVSMAVSQKGLMYISCLYDACSDSGNSIYVLDLVSGEFVENLDVSYNGVGSLLVHGEDLYVAEYLSFGLRKFPLPLVVDLLEEELARELLEREMFAQCERERIVQIAHERCEQIAREQHEREEREREQHEHEQQELQELRRKCEEHEQQELQELRRKREEREREYERECEYERAQYRARRELEEQELRIKREQEHERELQELRIKREERERECERECEREQRELQELRIKREVRELEYELEQRALQARRDEYEREQRELHELRIKCQCEYEREQRELQELRQKREELELEYELEQQARHEELEQQERREFQARRQKWAEMLEIHNFIPTLEKHISETPVSETSTLETPVSETSTLEKQISETSTLETSASETSTLETSASENLKTKFKKQFSSVGGFTYNGMEKPIQKMGMKHF